MEWISNKLNSVLLHLNRTFHRTTCASECCSNRCECTNEGESSGEEIPATSHHHGHEPNQTNIRH